MNACLHRRRWSAAGRTSPHVALFLLLASCTSVITPPEHPVNPVSVFVADYGPLHTSVIVPLDDEFYVEYAFGEHTWFAERKNAWYRCVPALCWPTAGTVARRLLPQSKSPVRLAHESGAEWFQLWVPSQKVCELCARMEPQFPQQDSVAVETTQFERASRNYHMLYTCNDAVIVWLRELGCAVRESLVRLDFALDSGL